jgi:hypothetical protein
VLCVGGILAHPQNLAAIQNAWAERLRVPDEIAYFRATDCRRVDGAFFKLRNKYGSGAQAVADKIRGDLEGILLFYSWIGFGIGVLIPDYREIWNSLPTTRRFCEFELPDYVMEKEIESGAHHFALQAQHSESWTIFPDFSGAGVRRAVEDH